MKEMAQEEIESLEPQLETLERRTGGSAGTKDEDEKDVIFEVALEPGRPLFAGGFVSHVQPLFCGAGLGYWLLDETPGTVGSYSKLVMEIEQRRYCTENWNLESIIRVHTFPETETKEPILHTSAASVAALPKWWNLKTLISERWYQQMQFGHPAPVDNVNKTGIWCAFTTFQRGW